MLQALTFLFLLFPVFLIQDNEVVDVRVSDPDAPPAEQIKAYNALPGAYSDEVYKDLNIENFESLPVFNREIDYTEMDYSVLNVCIVMYTNKYRNSKGLPALEFRQILRDAAVYHTLQMVNKRFYGHENPHQRKFKTVVDRLGFLGFEGRNMAENLARDFIHHYNEKSPYWYDQKPSGKNDFYYGDNQEVKGLIVPKTYRELAKTIVAKWVRSPQHRQNILNKDYTWVGVAALIDFVNVETNKLPKVFVTQVLGG
ncbi:MAG: CAP domain-containing protein [Chitinophagales bacterium]